MAVLVKMTMAAIATHAQVRTGSLPRWRHIDRRSVSHRGLSILRRDERKESAEISSIL